MSTALPQLERLFLTDSGLETDLLFNHGFDLPQFAAFPLLADAAGRQRLHDYYQEHIAIATAAGTGFVLESPTWRASPDWATALGIDAAGLDALNRDAIALMRALRDTHGSAQLPIVISGCVGPRGDGYRADPAVDIATAAAYHAVQIASLAAAGADMITAITMTTVSEAAGIALAAQAVGLAVAISFTLEIDGRLPDGSRLQDAIAAVDAATDGLPAYYMINCAHPDHFSALLDSPAPWQQRLRGLRANASTLSHAELDAMTSLDSGDPIALAAAYRALVARLPQLTVLGGCCGTDCRHIAAIADCCA
jgi:S-methylmethionine-dependent homocysteine/selenocysteine methylase